MTRSLVLTVLVICHLSAAATAKTAITFSGRVIDKVSRNTVANATVRISELSLYLMTDRDGMFELSGLEQGHYTVTISHVSYDTTTILIVLSDQTNEPYTVELQPRLLLMRTITVTPGRVDQDAFLLPVNISVKHKETFQEGDFSTTAELLRSEPGVLVQKTTHGHGSPILRGLIGKYVLLLYKGIRLNKPTFRFGANQYMNTVDLETLDRIEVIRGPSSVMYGSDAIGGAINLIPSSPSHSLTGFRLIPSLVTRYSSSDNGVSGHLKLIGSDKYLAASYDVTFKDIGDLRGGGNVGVQTPTGWSEVNQAACLTYRPTDEHAVVIDFLRVHQKNVSRYDKYAGGLFERYLYDPQDRDLVAVTYKMTRPQAAFHHIKINLSYQRETEGQSTRKTGSTETNLYDDRIRTLGGSIQASSAIDSTHWLTYGLEYYNHRINSGATVIEGNTSHPGTSEFPDGSKYTSFGLFIQDLWWLSDRLRLTSGLRYSRINVMSPLSEPFGDYIDTFENLTGSLGMSVQVAPATNLVGRWARSFRAPNLNDAVVLKYSSSGVDAPSPWLKPETGNHFEIGAKVHTVNVSGDLFLFYTRLSDLIDRRPGTYNNLAFFDENGNGLQDQDEFDIFQKYNVGSARIVGVEYRGFFMLATNWEIRSDLSWIHGENVTDNEPLSRIPPLMGRIAIRHQVNRQLWGEISTRFADAQHRLSNRDIDDTRIGPNGTPAWSTISASLGLAVSDISGTFILENIADTKYKEHGSGIYAPGRGVVLSLRFTGQ